MLKKFFIMIIILSMLVTLIPINSNASISYQGKAFPDFPERLE